MTRSETMSEAMNEYGSLREEILEIQPTVNVSKEKEMLSGFYDRATTAINKNRLDEELVEIAQLQAEVQKIKDDLTSQMAEHRSQIEIWRNRMFLMVRQNPREWGVYKPTEAGFNAVVGNMSKHVQSEMDITMLHTVENKYNGLLNIIRTKHNCIVSLVSLFKTRYFNEEPAMYVEN